MVTRYPLFAALLAAAFALPAQSQDATKEPAKPTTQSGPAKKSDAAMQNCRDHMSTQKGQKRSDAPMDADTEKACADHAAHGDASSKAAKKPAKSGTQSGEMPAGPNESKTNTNK